MLGCQKKGKKMKKKFFVLNKYQRGTLFKNIVFRSVALVTKKLWAILDF